MAGLSDFKIKSLKPVEGKRLEVADEHGLYLEVLPSGSKVWRYRYALHSKREKVTIGPYPEFGIADARKQRLLFSEMVAKGQSPAKTKQRELSAYAKANSVRELGELYITEIVNVHFKRPIDTERYFHRDIFPCLGITNFRKSHRMMYCGCLMLLSREERESRLRPKKLANALQKHQVLMRQRQQELS